MAKAKMVRIGSGNERQMQLRVGEQGTGRVVARVNYWPNSRESVVAAREMLRNAAAREGLEVVKE